MDFFSVVFFLVWLEVVVSGKGRFIAIVLVMKQEIFSVPRTSSEK